MNLERGLSRGGAAVDAGASAGADLGTGRPMPPGRTTQSPC